MKKTRRINTCNFKNITRKNISKKYILSKDFDLFDIKYNEPKIKDMAVGLVYFNSAKSKRILMNYLYAREKFKVANIPTYTIEMYIDTPEIEDAIHIKSKFILFQKERLCYLLEKKIPKKFSKLLFIDSDLIFKNADWYNELSEKLNTTNIVQPFSRGVWLDITYKKSIKQRIPIAFYEKFGKVNLEGGIGGYHPGFAWGFQRDWYNKVGFFQYGILGDGDTLSSVIWMNYTDFNFKDYVIPAIEEYKKSIVEKPSICYLDTIIFHLWHGDSKKRQYSERRKIFKSVKDIRDIIRIADNGLFELKDNTYKSNILKYFKNRDDDGLEVV